MPGKKSGGRFLAVLGIAVAGILSLENGAQASSTITRTSSWTYNSTTGLMMSETVQSTSTATSSCISSTSDNTCSVTTSYTYDTYGNKLTSTITGTSLPTPQNGNRETISARTTTTAYDSQGEFATTITNPLGQSETWTYDPRFGVPLTHTGPNGLTTRWTYDTLGRKTLETRADGTYTSWAFTYAQDYGPLTEYYITTKVFGSDNVQAAPYAYSIFDALGRQVETSHQAYNGTTLTAANVLTQYNADGQIAQTSNPYFTGGAQVWTTLTYDALGRVATVTKPYLTTGSKTSHSYNGLTTAVTDTQGGVTTSTDNDMGLPVSVQDAAHSTTTYAYDALGDLTQINDPAGHTTTYTYDNEGRKIAMSDPDRGNWTYAYDALGNLIQQTDADGQLTLFGYDALGRRLYSEIFAGQSVRADNINYDSAANGIGQMSQAASFNLVNGSWVEIYIRQPAYDAYCRPDGGATEFSGGSTVTTAVTYDKASRVSTVTYPSGFNLTDIYNAIGQLSAVAGTPAGSTTSQTLWTLNASDPAGQIAQETLGNGVVVSNTYDAYTMQLDGTVAGLSAATQTGDSSSANVANFTYTRDNLGNLTARTDADADTPNIGTAPAELSETFGYDNLYRLTSQSLSNGITKSFGYDSLGDMTSKSDTGIYSYANTAHVHAISSIAGIAGSSYNVTTSYTYDANGNQLTGDGYTTSWTSFNMPLAISEGSMTVAYTYGYDYSRVSQATNVGGTAEGLTNYLNDASIGVRSEQAIAPSGAVTWTDYIYAGPEMIGMHVTPSTGSSYNRFFIHDHLGSIAVVTGDIACSGLTLGGTGSCLVERNSYDAWGKRRNAITWADDVNNSIGSTTTRGYTGHEMVQNTSTGFELINMNARMYDPVVGRFMSTDPLIQEPGNLQDLNPYTYVLNNPLSLIDPTGQGFFSFVLAIVAIAVAIFVPEALFALESVYLSATTAVDLAIVNSVLGGAAAGAISSGGSWQGALIGGAEAGAFFEVGTLTQGHFNFNASGNLTNGTDSLAKWALHGGFEENVAGHGLVGGLVSLAEGGSFESGFLSAGFGDVAGVGIDVGIPGNTTQGFYEDLAASTISGGVGSVLGGGKFANGAETGAFGYLFNQEAEDGEEEAAQDQNDGLSSEENFDLEHPFLSQVFQGISDIYDDLIGGTPVGTQGSSPNIREIQGGLPEAQDLFQKLSNGGIPIQNSYPGLLVQMPSGGTVGLRTIMSNSPNTAATIDINNDPTIPNMKLKFNP